MIKEPPLWPLQLREVSSIFHNYLNFHPLIFEQVSSRAIFVRTMITASIGLKFLYWDQWRSVFATTAPQLWIYQTTSVAASECRCGFNIHIFDYFFLRFWKLSGTFLTFVFNIKKYEVILRGIPLSKYFINKSFYWIFWKVVVFAVSR